MGMALGRGEDDDFDVAYAAWTDRARVSDPAESPRP
jgi:hypothetical protein